MSEQREFVIRRDPIRWGSWMVEVIKPDGQLMPIGFTTTHELLEIEPGLKKIVTDREIKKFWAMEGPDK